MTPEIRNHDHPEARKLSKAEAIARVRRDWRHPVDVSDLIWEIDHDVLVFTTWQCPDGLDCPRLKA